MYWNDHSPPHFHAKYGESIIKYFMMKKNHNENIKVSIADCCWLRF